MTVAVDVLPTGFTIRFSGVDVLAGWRRELFVPFDRVVGTRVLTRAEALDSSPHLACPGLWWPHRFRVGSWGLGERRQLWGVRRGARVVVVYLSGQPFHRVVVDVDEPERMHHLLDAGLLRCKKAQARRAVRSSIPDQRTTSGPAAEGALES